MTHLSVEQIARWMAGERTAEAELHAAGCARCRAELVEFEDTLAQFRSSARSVVAPEAEGWREKAPALPRRMRWVAVAAVALLALVPVYRERQAREREQQDVELLQQVDAEISRAVPGSMDPLVKMVSWNQNKEQK